MSCGRTGRLGNVSFKKEASWGTYLTPDINLRIMSESLNRAIEHGTDDSLIGSIYPDEYIKVKDGAAGSLDGNMHGDTIGPLMHGVTGVDSVSDPISGFIIVNYNGSSNYARLTLTGTNLLAEDSTDGSSWSADTNFGTGGTLDISTTTTITDLNTVIDGYSGWSSTIFGDGAILTSNIGTFTATNVFENGENAGGKMIAAEFSGSTTAKTHTLSPAGAGECLPSYTFLINRVLGTDKSVGFVGSKFSSISVSSEAGDLCKISVAVDCKEELEDQTDVTLATPDVQAFVTPKVKLLLVRSDGSQVDFDEVSSHSITINTNVDDNRNIGTYTKNEQVRQASEIEISFTANNTATQYGVRPDYSDDKEVELYAYYESTTDVDTTNAIPYSMLIRLNAVKLTNYNSPLSTGDRLTIDAAGKAQKPKGTNTNHVDVMVTDNITSTY